MNMRHIAMYLNLVLCLYLTHGVSSTSIGGRFDNGFGYNFDIGTSGFGGGISRYYDNGNFGIRGHLDSSGDHGVGVWWTHRFRRRSVKVQRFNVTLIADPCKFDVYDQDNDGNISKEEMTSMFGGEAAADRLFDALDREPADGVIVREEFASAQGVINGCFQNSHEAVNVES